jgi:hypothetical protein
MSQKFKNALETAVRGARRATRAATMYCLVQGRWWQALPFKTLLALFLVGIILVGVHHSHGVTAGDYFSVATQAMLGLSSPSKFLYSTSEAKKAISIGTTRLYELINSGILDTRRYGKRTYITSASLEAFVASLPRALTPTLMKAEHNRWSGRRPPAAIPEDGAERDRRSGPGNPRADLEEDATE